MFIPTHTGFCRQTIDFNTLFFVINKYGGLLTTSIQTIANLLHQIAISHSLVLLLVDCWLFPRFLLVVLSANAIKSGRSKKTLHRSNAKLRASYNSQFLVIDTLAARLTMKGWHSWCWLQQLSWQQQQRRQRRQRLAIVAHTAIQVADGSLIGSNRFMDSGQKQQLCGM